MILNIIHIMKELWQHGISLIHSLAIMLLTVSTDTYHRLLVCIFFEAEGHDLYTFISIFI